MGYIIIGTGRCGTSSVAKVLHENMGVCMGEEFVRNEVSNQGGTYEDKQIWSLNRLLFKNKINYVDWSYVLQTEIGAREKSGKPWGIKDPMLSYFIGEIIGYCKEFPRIIWCKRNRALVLKSMQKNWANTLKQARVNYQGKDVFLSRVLSHVDHLEIDFKKDWLEDADIIERIRGKWNDA